MFENIWILSKGVEWVPEYSKHLEVLEVTDQSIKTGALCTTIYSNWLSASTFDNLTSEEKASSKTERFKRSHYNKVKTSIGSTHQKTTLSMFTANMLHNLLKPIKQGVFIRSWYFTCEENKTIAGLRQLLYGLFTVYERKLRWE